MDGSASYLDTCKKLLDEFSEDGKGSCYLLISPEGHGKSEIVAYLQDKLKPGGVRFFRGSSYYKSELARYHVFNEILNDAFEEVRNRDSEELIKGYLDLIAKSGPSKPVIIVEGLESVSDESRDFFLYLSRLTGKHNFKLIGTFTTNFAHSGNVGRRFLELLETEELVNSIHIDRMRLDDFKFYLDVRSYNLPERFVNDLFRLVDGNINTLKYTLKYYEDHGIINGEREVDDVLYRFFPIPQALEIHYERIFSELTEKQSFVADLLALIEEETSYKRLSRLASIDVSETLRILSKLEKAGIVVEQEMKYDISNYRLRDFIQGRMSNTRKLQIFSVLSESDIFGELPLQMQLNILLQQGEVDYVDKLLQEQGSSIIYKFASLKSLISFLTEFLEKGKHSPIVCLTKCEALGMLGESDSAISCYEDVISEFPDNIMPKLNLARIKANAGKYSTALDLIGQIGSASDLDGTGRGLVSLVKSDVLSKKRDYEEAYKIASEAREILRSEGNREKEAEALNVLGNVCLETFRHDEAMKYYEEALQINRNLGMLVNSAKNLNNIAILKSYRGNYDETVRIFKELIENSYLTGDLLTRAYSTYNIAETYYLIGKIEEAKSYTPSAVRLAELSNIKDLKYRFFRFLSVLYLNELDVRNSLEASEKALEAVSENKNGEFYKIAYAMREFFSELVTKEPSDILPSLFLEDFPVDEEYLPIFYSMGAIYFVFKGDFVNANWSADKCMERADKMGEKYGTLMARLHKALVLFYQNEGDELAEFVQSCPGPNTGSRKYDYLMKVLSLSSRAAGMSRKDFERGIEEISKDQRQAVDLVRLYKETIVLLTLKRTYGVPIETGKIVAAIPNHFKYAFNVFAENNSIS